MKEVTITGGFAAMTTFARPRANAPSRARAPARTRGTSTNLQNGSATMATETEDTGSIAAQELRLFIERVERLEEEIKGINDDKKEVYSEMKGRGYDTKIVKKVLAIRRKKKGEHEEEEMVLETYLSALGMI